MPLEIKELHIKVSVNPGGENSSTPSGSVDASAGKQGSGSNQEQLIQTIIEQVMDILKEKMER